MLLTILAIASLAAAAGALAVACSARRALAREQLVNIRLQDELIAAEEESRSWRALSRALLRGAQDTDPRSVDAICRRQSARFVTRTLDRIARTA